MFTDTKAFSGFSVNDLKAAKEFYGDTLGLVVEETSEGLTLKVAGSNGIFVYQKDNHEPASYTILNFPVDDIDKAAEALMTKGITLEHYDNMGQDEKGIMRGQGEDIAWFTDPAGNILSILH